MDTLSLALNPNTYPNRNPNQVGLFYAPHYNGIGGRLSFQDTRRGRMEADNKRIIQAINERPPIANITLTLTLTLIQAIKERHLANITRLVDEATATEGLALIPPAQRSNAHANVYGSGKGGSCPPDLPAGGPAAE